MKLAIASGKGGTGKTSLAVSLALAVSDEEPVTLLDCDVEEPNCHLFLNTDGAKEEPVAVKVPVVDKDACTGCGRCAEVCRFNALAALKSGAMVFPELCHSCGACVLVCEPKALTEGERTLGKVIHLSPEKNLEFAYGLLNVGEAITTPVIGATQRYAAEDGLTILDAPPGTSCPMVATVRESDYVLLVTEPTPFGLHDLTLAVETVRSLGVPFAVVLNRADGDRRVHEYCSAEKIELALEIPDSRTIAEGYSKGIAPVRSEPELGDKMRALLASIRGKGTA